MDNFKYPIEDLPYDVLATFGLTQEMIDDLPESVMKAILNGMRSPVLPITRMGRDGKKYKDKARIRLTETEEGIDILLLPCYGECNISEFNEDIQNILISGAVVKCNVNEKGMCFIQLDRATNRLLIAPADVIEQNISILKNSLSISDKIVEEAKKGNVAVSTLKNETFAFGVDLLMESGIRIAKGDAEKWSNAAEIDNNRYFFGIFGCWVTNAIDEMSYVSEDNYTPEMLAIQQREYEKAKRTRGVTI